MKMGNRITSFFVAAAVMCSYIPALAKSDVTITTSGVYQTRPEVYNGYKSKVHGTVHFDTTETGSNTGTEGKLQMFTYYPSDMVNDAQGTYNNRYVNRFSKSGADGTDLEFDIFPHPNNLWWYGNVTCAIWDEPNLKSLANAKSFSISELKALQPMEWDFSANDGKYASGIDNIYSYGWTDSNGNYYTTLNNLHPMEWGAATREYVNKKSIPYDGAAPKLIKKSDANVGWTHDGYVDTNYWNMGGTDDSEAGNYCMQISMDNQVGANFTAVAVKIPQDKFEIGKEYKVSLYTKNLAGTHAIFYRLTNDGIIRHAADNWTGNSDMGWAQFSESSPVAYSNSFWTKHEFVIEPSAGCFADGYTYLVLGFTREFSHVDLASSKTSIDNEPIEGDVFWISNIRIEEFEGYKDLTSGWDFESPDDIGKGNAIGKWVSGTSFKTGDQSTAGQMLSLAVADAPSGSTDNVPDVNGLAYKEWSVNLSATEAPKTEESENPEVTAAPTEAPTEPAEPTATPHIVSGDLLWPGDKDKTIDSTPKPLNENFANITKCDDQKPTDHCLVVSTANEWCENISIKTKLHKDQFANGIGTYNLEFDAMSTSSTAPYSYNDNNAFQPLTGYSADKDEPWVETYVQYTRNQDWIYAALKPFQTTKDLGMWHGRNSGIRDWVFTSRENNYAANRQTPPAYTKQYWQHITIPIEVTNASFDKNGYANLWMTFAVYWFMGMNYDGKDTKLPPGENIYLDNIKITPQSSQ